MHASRGVGSCASFERSSAGRSSRKPRRRSQRVMRSSTRSATVAISWREGAGPSRPASDSPSRSRTKTPSSAPTCRWTKFPSVELKRWTKVTLPVSPLSMPRAFACCFCHRAISSTKIRFCAGLRLGPQREDAPDLRRHREHPLCAGTNRHGERNERVRRRRSSEPRRPRVLRRCPRGRRRSMDRGTCGRGYRAAKSCRTGCRRCSGRRKATCGRAPSRALAAALRGPRTPARTESPCAGTGRSAGCSPRW
jgi:hypothetical protein